MSDTALNAVYIFSFNSLEVHKVGMIIIPT